jgi:hypothetical protein
LSGWVIFAGGRMFGRSEPAELGRVMFRCCDARKVRG